MQTPHRLLEVEYETLMLLHGIVSICKTQEGLHGSAVMVKLEGSSRVTMWVISPFNSNEAWHIEGGSWWPAKNKLQDSENVLPSDWKIPMKSFSVGLFQTCWNRRVANGRFTFLTRIGVILSGPGTPQKMSLKKFFGVLPEWRMPSSCPLGCATHQLSTDKHSKMNLLHKIWAVAVSFLGSFISYKALVRSVS